MRQKSMKKIIFEYYFNSLDFNIFNHFDCVFQIKNYIMIVILVKRIRNMPFIVSCIRISILIIFIITSCFYVLLRNKYVSELHLNNEKIVVSRDEHNIPHILAPTYSSTMYAWGHVLAEDRLFQLAFRRTMLKGRLSQYTGQKSLVYDKLFR